MSIYNSYKECPARTSDITSFYEQVRLHGTRLMVGVHAVIPFESRRGIDTFNPGIHVRVGF